jgi:hypothetical protein
MYVPRMPIFIQTKLFSILMFEGLIRAYVNSVRLTAVTDKPFEYLFKLYLEEQNNGITVCRPTQTRCIIYFHFPVFFFL